MYSEREKMEYEQRDADAAKLGGNICFGGSLTLAELIFRAEQRFPGIDFDRIDIYGGAKGEFFMTHSTEGE